MMNEFLKQHIDNVGEFLLGVRGCQSRAVKPPAGIRVQNAQACKFAKHALVDRFTSRLIVSGTRRYSEYGNAVCLADVSDDDVRDIAHGSECTEALEQLELQREKRLCRCTAVVIAYEALFQLRGCEKLPLVLDRNRAAELRVRGFVDDGHGGERACRTARPLWCGGVRRGWRSRTHRIR